MGWDSDGRGEVGMCDVVLREVNGMMVGILDIWPLGVERVEIKT